MLFQRRLADPLQAGADVRNRPARPADLLGAAQVDPAGPLEDIHALAGVSRGIQVEAL